MSTYSRSKPEIADDILVLRCQVGDEAAFEELFERYNARILYYLRRLMGTSGEAEDVLQNVWVKIVRRIGALREPKALRAWLYRIAHNEAIGLLRKKGREIALEDLERVPDVEAEADIEALGATELDAVSLHRALERTSPEHRAVLTLRFMNDLSYREIADVIGCSLGTVKSRLHFAKRALRAEIECTNGGIG